MKTLTYTHLVNCTEVESSINATEEEAIQSAMRALDAEPYGDGWIYLADETGHLYYVDREGMITAGAAILGGAPDWYSLWCTCHGDQLREEDELEYRGQVRCQCGEITGEQCLPYD